MYSCYREILVMAAMVRPDPINSPRLTSTGRPNESLDYLSSYVYSLEKFKSRVRHAGRIRALEVTD